MYMYVKTNTVLKKMHVYINTTQILNIFLDRVFYLWTDLPGARFDCAEKIDCLPDYQYLNTRPLFSGRGRGVRWGYPLATIVPTAPSDTLQYYQAVNLCFRNCTLILQYFFCLFREMFTYLQTNMLSHPIYTAIKRRSTELPHKCLSSIAFYEHWIKWS